MTENDLAIKGNKYFESLGYEIVREVPKGNRCIDSVAIKNGFYRSIEYKLDNWKKAIEQAKDHQWAFDKSYICMPKLSYVRFYSVIEYCKLEGIGFISLCDDEFKLIVRAKRNKIWKPNRNNLIKVINKIKGVCD